jgi:hypothetical protein
MKRCEGEEIFLGQFIYNKTETTVQTFELQVTCALGKDVSDAITGRDLLGLLYEKCWVTIIRTKA